MDHYVGWKPSIIKYTTNLNEEAIAGNLEPIAGREKEISQLVSVLSRRTKHNPLLIGEPGVGKTSIIEGLVQKIVKKDVPKNLQNLIILQLDFSSLTAGASHKGEFEERLRELISDLLITNDVILFIDDIHLLITDSAEKLNAASIFKKYLDDNLLSLIGATSFDMYEKYFDKNKAFDRDFQLIHVEEPTAEDTLTMLQSQRKKLETFHKVKISDAVLTAAITLTEKYLTERMLPDKAIDVIDEAAATVKLQIEKGERISRVVRKSDIQKVISDWMRISIMKLSEDESEKLLQLEKLIHKKYAGQNTAVGKVAEVVRRGRIGLGLSNKPKASFLFVGGTGVGKTELVKVLTEVLFETKDALLQLDMSEYMDKNDIAKLIGAPPGYTGYDEGGILTQAMNKRPSCIILMDNIEKAHTDVMSILLQVLDEGHLTDNKGKKVSFQNAMIVCTTSHGTKSINEIVNTIDNTNDSAVEKELENALPGVKEELLKILTPELVNRFDEIVGFTRLNKKDLEEISRLLLTQTAIQLKQQEYILQTTQQVISEVAKYGISTDEGARPLRRIITEVVENPIANAIIARRFMPGDTILVEFVPDKGFSISNSSSQILHYTKISLPRIKDIVLYDTAFVKKEKARLQEIDNIRILLQKLANLDDITDPFEKAGLEELKKQLLAEKEKGNPLADVILQAETGLLQGKPSVIPLPSVNGIQVISDEEFDEVKNIWLENYMDMQATGNNLETQIEWVETERNLTDTMIKIFASETPEDNEHVLQQLAGILPFLLIGGFTKEQVREYLEAKSQAAKAALEALYEEQETTISVKRTSTTQQAKSLHIQQE